MRAVSVRLPDWLVAAVDELAEADRRQRSDLLRFAVEEWVIAKGVPSHKTQADVAAANTLSSPRLPAQPPAVQPSYSTEPAGWDEPDPLNDIA